MEAARTLLQTRAIMAMLRGFATVAALTLAAKAVSFFKDATVAHQFGTADQLDAYVLAFTFWSFLASVLELRDAGSICAGVLRTAAS